VSIVLLAVTAVLAIGLVVWFFLGQNPAQGEGGVAKRADTDAERFYGTSERPAGPDAEAMAPDSVIEPPAED
jgi:hypothetical protein